MRTYNKNLETGKIEFRFIKSDYISLSEAEKKEIKSTFLFSSYAGCWVSRSSQNTWSAENLCKKMGATFQGETGEKLTFEKQIEAKQEKAENRSERYQNLAYKAEAQSTAAYEQSNKIASFIPFGQPILVGHHSEKRHRRDINKIHSAMGKSVELSNKAEYFKDRAETAERTASGAQYSNPIYLGNRIREVEAKLRELNRYLSGIGYVVDGRTTTAQNAITISEGRKHQLDARVAEETEKLNFFREKLSVFGIETKESLKAKKCTHIKYGATWYPVKSFNGKTVTILNWMNIPGNAWAWPVAYTDIKGIKTIEDMFIVLDRDGNENKCMIKYKH